MDFNGEQTYRGWVLRRRVADREPMSPYIGVGVMARNGLGGVLGYREDGGRATVVCSV
jgi:hypothetical protein